MPASSLSRFRYGQDPARSGAVSLRLIIFLALLAVVGIWLVGYFPLWLDHRELTSRVDYIVRSYDTHPPPYGPEDARQAVLRAAGEIGIPLPEEAVQVRDEGTRVRARARYRRTMRVVPIEVGFELDVSASGP